MKRQFTHDYSLNEAIERLLLAYWRETGEIVSVIDPVPSYDQDDELVQFYVRIEVE